MRCYLLILYPRCAIHFELGGSSSYSVGFTYVYCQYLMFIMLPFHAAFLRQIRLRTETLTKIKEENVAVAAEIAAERRVKKKLSQHRVRPPSSTLHLFQRNESTCRVVHQ